MARWRSRRTCWADGPGVVKGGREACTEGPTGRVTSRGGWHLGHRRVQVYMVMKTASAKSIWRRWRRGTWRRPVGRVKEEGEGVMLGRRSDTRRHLGFGGFILKTIGGGRVWSMLLMSGLVVWASKPSVAGLRVCALKPGRRFRGGTDGTWRHRGVRVEVKLLVRRRGGRQMKMTQG
jgi:hypothetical protein